MPYSACKVLSAGHATHCRELQRHAVRLARHSLVVQITTKIQAVTRTDMRLQFNLLCSVLGSGASSRTKVPGANNNNGSSHRPPMSVDLSAPEIAHAYEQVRAKQLDWLLLTYGQTRDKLSLLATGSGGVEELVQRLPEDDVYFAFVREEEKDRSYFCLVSYVPEKTNALVAARALVHSRAVATTFKAHHATMSVSKRDDISTRAVRAKLRLDAQPRQRNITQFDGDLEVQPSRIPVRSDTLPAANGFHPRAATETPRSVSDSTMHHARAGTSAILGGARVASPSPKSTPTRARSPANEPAYDAPPPPPKDPDRDSYIRSPTSSILGSPRARSPPHNGNGHGHFDLQPPSPTTSIPTIPDDGHSYYGRPSFAESSAPGRPSFADTRISAFSAESAYSQSTTTLAHDFAARQQQRLPPIPVPTPLPRGVTLPRKSLEERQREIEEQRRKERREAEELARREQEEQEARRRARAEQQRREELEEEARRQKEEQERRRWVAERQRKAEQRRQEEERKAREEEERKAVEMLRRVEEARRAKLRREEEQRAAEEERKWHAAQREREEREKLERLKSIAKQFVAEAGGEEVALSGECTVQTSWSNVWRRRYFELNNDTMTFYKHEADPQPLDVLRIKGRVGRIATWRDGYDELQAIPHSFAVELTDDEGPWFFYTDSEEAKDVLVGLISKACGLL